MTNQDIIIQEAIVNEIFTEEEIKKTLESGRELPLHTYTAWIARGYKVKHGERAAVKTKLWKCRTKTNEDGTDTRTMYLVKAALFTKDQVEKIKTA